MLREDDSDKDSDDAAAAQPAEKRRRTAPRAPAGAAAPSPRQRRGRGPALPAANGTQRAAPRRRSSVDSRTASEGRRDCGNDVIRVLMDAITGRGDGAAASGRDGSGGGSPEWRVQCLCGVTYDDGQEMVECEACQCWAHTACLQLVLGPACDLEGCV